MLYDFYNYKRSPLPRLLFIVIDGAEKRKDRTQLLYSSFSLTIDLRASAVSIARVFFESPGRGPAVSLNTSGIARSFSILTAAALPYREYEQVSALFLSDPAILSRAEKRFLIQFFFSLLSS